MKRLLPYCMIFLLAATSMNGCQQDPLSIGQQPVHPMGNSHSNGRIDLVWLGAAIINNVTYSAIYVADTALGGEARPLVAASSISVIRFGGFMGWSPTGSSVVIGQYGVGSAPDTIKAFDLTSNKSATNIRAIVSQPDQTVRLHCPAWSSTTTMGKIAYTTIQGTTNSVRVVSQSGGTPTTVWTVDTAWVHDAFPLSQQPAWSPDDSRLAVARIDSGGASTMIMIFNTSTWACVDSIRAPGAVVGIEWSRTGSTNKLAFGLQAAGSAHAYLYYCTPTTGSTPTTNGIEGSCPTWAPNNSSAMFVNTYTHNLYKNPPLSSSTTFVSNFSSVMRWKR